MTEAERNGWFLRHRRYRNQDQDRDWARRFARLTGREREVLDLLTRGHRAAQVAQHFTVPSRTARTQIRAILAKLEVNTQLEAMALTSQRPYLGASEHN